MSLIGQIIKSISAEIDLLKQNENPDLKQYGLIQRIHGHFYYAKDLELTGPNPVTAARTDLYDLTLPSRLQKEGVNCLVGDLVEFDCQHKIVKKVFPRESELLRPKVANVDQALLIIANTQPEPELDYVDRLLCQASLALSLKPLICITKVDIESDTSWSQLYKGLGYEVFEISNSNGQGIEDLKNKLCGFTSVLSGQSGVGKTSLLQNLFPGRVFKIAEVSQKLQRGTHTTRHTEIFDGKHGLQSFYILDAPGFSRLDIQCSPLELAQSKAFPEVALAEGKCRFDDCLHLDEEGCRVQFSDLRAKSYHKLMAEAEIFRLNSLETDTKENREKNKQADSGSSSIIPKLNSSQRTISRKTQKQNYQKDEF